MSGKLSSKNRKKRRMAESSFSTSIVSNNLNSKNCIHNCTIQSQSALSCIHSVSISQSSNEADGLDKENVVSEVMPKVSLLPSRENSWRDSKLSLRNSRRRVRRRERRKFQQLRELVLNQVDNTENVPGNYFTSQVSKVDAGRSLGDVKNKENLLGEIEIPSRQSTVIAKISKLSSRNRKRSVREREKRRCLQPHQCNQQSTDSACSTDASKAKTHSIPALKRKNDSNTTSNPLKRIHVEYTKCKNTIANGSYEGLCFRSIVKSTGQTYPEKFTFNPGDTIQCTQGKYEGLAFTIGKRVDKVSAECLHVWMKAERTYLGDRMKDLGYEWVLLKKHWKHSQICIGKVIDLKYLWHGKKLEDMDASTTLCYEEENPKSAFAYYFELGEQLNNAVRPSSSTQKQPVVLDLCAGGGGMSVGLKNAGFNVKYKVDSNETACDTLRRNFPESRGVRTLTLAKYLEKLQSGQIKIAQSSPIVLVHGSPPCQAFSRVNTSGGVNDVMNAQCTLDFLNVAKFLSPPFVSMENVPGLLDNELVHGTNNPKNSYLKRVITDLIGKGYGVRVCKVIASDYGDPTKRERVIMFAAKKGWKLPSRPAPTHGIEKGLAPIVTCSDILKDLEIDPVSNDEPAILNDGRKVWGHFEEKTILTEKHEEYEFLKANKPAITMRKKNPVKHYSLDRFITVLERARLMSFPYNYIFEGSLQDCCDQIGNAVPVKLSEAIGKAVMECYELGQHSVPTSTDA